MLAEIREFRICDGYRIEIRFADGVQGTVDLSDLVGRGVFEGLRNPAEFARAQFDEFGALSWPSGADLAPDAMHEALARDGFWKPVFAKTPLPA